MLLAHLRGLIRPGYKYGITSFLAEQKVLEAIAKEIDTDAHRQILELKTKFFQPNQKNFRELSEDVVRLRAMRLMEKVEPRKLTKTHESLVKLYEALAKAGLVSKPGAVDPKRVT